MNTMHSSRFSEDGVITVAARREIPYKRRSSRPLRAAALIGVRRLGRPRLRQLPLKLRRRLLVLCDLGRVGLHAWAMALDDAHPIAHRRAARFRRSVPTRRVVISSAKLARRAWIQTARNGSFRFNGVILVHRGHVCGRSIPPSPRDSMREEGNR